MRLILVILHPSASLGISTQYNYEQCIQCRGQGNTAKMVSKRRSLPSAVVCMLALSPMAGSSRAFCPGVVTPSNKSSSTVPLNPVSLCIQNQYGVLKHRKLSAPRLLYPASPERILQPNFRGGAQSTAAKSKEDEVEDTPEEKWRRRGMTAALASTYFAVMGAKCALPSVLSLLTNSKTGLSYNGLDSGVTPQSLMAKLLGLSTLAVAMGKLLLGPIIDTLGGIRALRLALIALASLVMTISFTQKFSVFAACWILVDFIFSSCWAGCINAIHQSFPEREWGKQIGILAGGARTGNFAAFALFATVLYALENKMNQPWRVVFGVSALLQVLPIALLTYFGRKTVKNAERNMQGGNEETASLQSSLRVLRRESRTLEFWLQLLSRSSLMVFASFLLFVPTLMSQVYGSSNAFAAQTGSIYALGCLLSVTFGSQLYSRLPKKKQAFANLLLMGTATFSSLAQLAHVSGAWEISATASAASMFLWGFAFSIPFYIPPSLYALARGGKQSSATIADVFDIGGFALLAVFNGYVASIQHAQAVAWIPTFQITTACSLTSLIALTLAVLLK